MMKNKRINVVWCDDNIDTIADESKKQQFENHNCVIYKTAKSSDELRKILSDEKDYIDAVIVDFNVGQSELIPENTVASGFRWIHDHLDDYSPIPFYLYSARDYDFIESKYKALDFNIEDDYFFNSNTQVESGRNRYFQPWELNDLLDMIEEEVHAKSTPEYQIRQQYSEAFDAIDTMGLDADVFMRILLADEDTDRFEVCELVNPIRKAIESLMSKCESAGVIPPEYLANLNKIPALLAGKDSNAQPTTADDYMPKSLTDAFDFLLKYTQDGSHDKNYLRIEFHDYLRKTGDIYLVKALGVIALDVIRWVCQMYRKYACYHIFQFEPFEAQVEKILNINGKEGARVIKDGKTYFIPQPRDQRFTYRKGTNIKVEKIKATGKEYGDYFVSKARNLDV